jgi:anti-sigma B factor antagonist
MSLNIEIQKNTDPKKAGAVTIKLIGSLDTATAPELDRQLLACLAGPVSDLVFDLGLLKFVSSAGLRLFSLVRKQMVARSGRASFINLQPQVEEVFAIIQSLPGIAIFKDLDALDRYLESRGPLPAHLQIQGMAQNFPPRKDTTGQG